MQYLYQFSEEWRFILTVSQTTFESDEGLQTEPDKEDLVLNDASWESFVLQAGVRYEF